MSDATPSPPPPPATPATKAGKIAASKIPSIFKPRTDRHCRHCAFSLEGSPEVGRCAECGTEYDPSNSRELLQAPSAAAAVAYLLLPLLLTVVLLPLATGLITGGPLLLFCLAPLLVPPCLVWFALRLGRFRTVMRDRVLPPGAAVAPGVRSLGCAAIVFSRALLVVSIVLTVAGIALIGWCLVAIANYRS